MKHIILASFALATILTSGSATAQTKTVQTKQKHIAGCPDGSTPKPVVRRHIKRKPMKMMTETINVDDRFKTAVIEINKGKVYYNDSLITEVKHAKWEDHKIVINYIVPPPPAAIPPAPPVTLDQMNPNTYTGNKNGDKGWLGVYTCTYCDDGAMIEHVISCSPAYKAGLHRGDVIKKVNDKEIESTQDLRDALAAYSAGDKVTITYTCCGHKQELEAKLAVRDTDENCGCETHKSYGCNTCGSLMYR